MNPLYPRVAERAGYVCEYCRAPESVFNFNFEIDHFIPLSKGGKDDLENLVLACRACNAYKAFHQIGLMKEKEDISLFNPRQNAWNEHFQFNFETFELEGLTKIGEGTINRLKMNDSVQIRARILWIQLEVFP